MSGILKITFTPDMPVTSVEVVGPDLQTVERVMMGPGVTKDVPVPSEASFLRLHLPSGKTVTVTDDVGSLERTISPEALYDRQAEAERPRRRTKSIAKVRDDRQRLTFAADTFETASPGWVSIGPRSNRVRAMIADSQGSPVDASLSADGQEAAWRGPGNTMSPPGELRIDRRSGPKLTVRLPGDLELCRLRADEVEETDALVASVSLTGQRPADDAIMAYLQLGDLSSAASMQDWAKDAQSLLQSKMADPYQSKMADPYGAAVGAYLLLRLGLFDDLHDWPRNLADLFDYLPDGCVIWASQLIIEAPEREDEIREYLLKAVGRGLPVYTEGLRLLIEGLRLLGDEDAYQSVVSKAGTVQWDSPLTATVRGRDSRTDPSKPFKRTVFEISFVEARPA